MINLKPGYLLPHLISEGRSLETLFHFIRRQKPFPLITPEELKRGLDAGERIVVIDLRHPLEVLPDPRSIPGALRIAPDEVQARATEIPHDRDVVLYCTCPNEATSARTAALLAKQGIIRIRLLAGGLHAWRECGYPLSDVLVKQTAVSAS